MDSSDCEAPIDDSSAAVCHDLERRMSLVEEKVSMLWKANEEALRMARQRQFDQEGGANCQMQICNAANPMTCGSICDWSYQEEEWIVSGQKTKEEILADPNREVPARRRQRIGPKDEVYNY